MLFGRDSELVVEGVVPDLLHAVPVGHNPTLDREGEHHIATGTSGAATGDTTIRVFGGHAVHVTLVFRLKDGGGKHCTRVVTSGEAGLRKQRLQHSL